MVDGIRGLSGISLIKALIPFMKAPLHDLITPKGFTSLYNHDQDEVSPYETGGGGDDRNLQFIADTTTIGFIFQIACNYDK